MKKIISFLPLLLLMGCSQYPDSKLLCTGEIEKEVSGQKITDKNQYLILKIQDDSIRVAKNDKVFKEWIRVCDKGSNPLANGEQIYFNVKSCEAKEEGSGLLFEGTYNFSSKKFYLKQNSEDESFIGNFTCQVANLSQANIKIKR
jgi:hypothetical protein